MTAPARRLLLWNPRILAIACPLLVVGVLFLWSWLHHDELRSDA